MGCPQVLGMSGPCPVPLPNPWHGSLTLVADKPGPALGAVAAVQAREAGPSIPAVITGQAAVWAEGVIQADWGQTGEGPQTRPAPVRGHRLWPVGLRRWHKGRPLPMKAPSGQGGRWKPDAGVWRGPSRGAWGPAQPRTRCANGA